jgi:hypothetical protein
MAVIRFAGPSGTPVLPLIRHLCWSVAGAWTRWRTRSDSRRPPHGGRFSLSYIHRCSHNRVTTEAPQDSSQYNTVAPEADSGPNDYAQLSARRAQPVPNQAFGASTRTPE